MKIIIWFFNNIMKLISLSSMKICSFLLQTVFGTIINNKSIKLVEIHYMKDIIYFL